jgi:tRNA A-37 threonylcarbamoyl transferase component Bud32
VNPLLRSESQQLGVTVDDEAFLDELFDRAVSSHDEGEPLDVSSIVAQRFHLRSRIEACVRLAADLGVRPERTAPRIEGFELVSRLGSGAGGTVYLARQLALGSRVVAIKVMHDGALAAGAARRRFVREARTLAQVRHTHVVRIHDVIETPRLCALVMDWIDGDSLADAMRERIAHGSLGESHARAALALDVGIAIARALGEVHRAGVVHRDVKPSNVLMSNDGGILLSDFGLARGRDDPRLTLTGQIVGTPAYAAPEVLRGDHECVGPWSDVYGLGATLFEIATGRLPLEGESSAAILRAIEGGGAPLLRTIDRRLSRDLEAIIAKAMEPDPARRYRDGDEMADDLQRLRDARPIQARPPGVARRALLFVRRHRLVLAGVACGVFAVLSFVALQVFDDWRTERSARLIAEAREWLLDPGYSEFALREATRNDLYDVPNTSEPRLDARLRRAVALYASAREFGVDLVPAARLEEEVAATALALIEAGGGREARLPASHWISGVRPIVEAWDSISQRRAAADVRIGRLERDELRALGLLAFVLGDAELAERALGAVDADGPMDPFGELALGLTHLAREQNHVASRRLDHASQEFSNSAFVALAAADAALRNEDVAHARRLLARSKGLSRPDGLDRNRRIEADIAVLDGDEEAALAKYEFMWIRHEDARSAAHGALLLAKRGALDEAVIRLSLAARLRPSNLAYSALLAEVGAVWWRSLEPRRAVEVIESLLASASADGSDSGAVLRACIAATRASRDRREMSFWTPFGSLFPESDILRGRISAPRGIGASVADYSLLEALMHLRPYVSSNPTRDHWLAIVVERIGRSRRMSGTHPRETTSFVRATALAAACLAAVAWIPAAHCQSVFSAPSTFSVNGQGCSGVAVADIDGDGDIDTAGGNSNGPGQLWVRLNDGAGAFPATATWTHTSAGVTYGILRWADFDGDGDLDFAVNRIAAGASGFEVFLGDGTGMFASAVLLNAGFPVAAGLVAADFDADGDDDVAFATYAGGSIEIYENRKVPSGTLSFVFVSSLATVSNANALVCADVDGNGAPDLAVGSTAASHVKVFLNTTVGNGAPSFGATPVLVATGTSPQGLVLQDLNGDGTLDLAVTSASSSVSIHHNQGGVGAGWNKFASSQTLTIPGFPHGIAAADLDSDGDIDLGIAEIVGRKLYVLVNSGSGAFTVSASTVPLPIEPRSLTAADLDGDFDVDLVGGANAAGTDITGNTGYVCWNKTPSFATYGNGCSIVGGAIPILHGTGIPKAGQVIGIEANGGAANAQALLFVAAQANDLAIPGAGGCAVLVGLSSTWIVPIVANPAGSFTISSPVPALAQDANLYLQAIWADPSTSTGLSGVTNGLRVAVSP